MIAIVAVMKLILLNTTRLNAASSATRPILTY